MNRRAHVDRYLVALRGELEIQLRRADIDRVAEEVEGHLLTAIDEAGADTDERIEAVFAAFGSPAEVGRAYRKAGFRSIAAEDDRRDGSRPSHRVPHALSSTPPRLNLIDLMNFSQIFRNLIRNPGFALVTIVTLALGIGANAVILSVVNGVLLKPLPFSGADRLVRVYHSAPGLNLDMDDIGLSQASYWYFRDQGVLEDLALYNTGAGNLSGGEEPQRVESVTVSHSFFDVLGVPPLIGRSFNLSDEDPEAPEVIILSEALWRTNFGADPNVIGTTVSLDSETVEIVGVMPERVTFPRPSSGLYEPMTLSREFRNLGSLGTDSVGRMPPGMTVEEAGAQLAARLVNLEDAFPDEPAAPILARAGLTAHAIDLQEEMVGDVEDILKVLMGSVGFILLIACANVANVFLVRAEGREREMAIRAAMGAGRGRLAVGYLAESAVLGLLAGGIGLLLAFAGVRALLRFGPDRMPRIEEIGIDATVMGTTLLISLLAGLVFGIIPTLRYNSAWMAAALKEGGRANTAGRARFRLRSVLVGAQVALALVLLVGSGLMVRSYRSLSAIDPGFVPDSMLTFRLMLNPQDYPGEEAPARFVQRLVDAISEMPGVVSVGAASGLPLTDSASGTGYAIEDHPLGEGDLPPVHFFRRTAPGYFETLRIPLIAGRTFSRADHEERRDAVIVNESFARLYWPDQDPIGRRIQAGGGAEPDPNNWYSVVGVVGDVRLIRLEDDPTAMVYTPMVAILREDDEGNRTSPVWDDVRNPNFAVRTSINPTALVDPVRQRIRELDPNLPIAGVQTMEQIVDDAMVQKSFTMLLLLVGSAGALLIGAVGIYGVISYVVAQQTREIGVRMVLGARTEDIGRMVLGRSMLITAVGIAVGIAGAWYLTRFMSSLLFGVDPLDPATFAAVVVTLAAVAALAAYLPARRASSVDPMEALRHE